MWNSPIISKFINAYKSASSRLIKKEFEEIRNKLWKEYFWSRSFCLLTTGGATIDIIRKYIEEQDTQWGDFMLRAYKYRIYPNKEQKIYLAKTFGCTRLIYNLMLSDRIDTYNK